MLNELEKKIIAALQGDIPLVKQPFAVLAASLDISEEKFIDIVKKLDERGIMRRFGATIKHQKSGFKANALVAWKVDEKKAMETGKIMASFDEVTHCYRRDPAETWPYNLYTMVHASNENQCHAIAKKISLATGVDEYSLLFSRKELKKTSMEYFD